MESETSRIPLILFLTLVLLIGLRAYDQSSSSDKVPLAQQQPAPVRENKPGGLPLAAPECENANDCEEQYKRANSSTDLGTIPTFQCKEGENGRKACFATHRLINNAP
ncbi:MAG: hypothetical protein AAB384_01360 [Patescibacteria group bacterium]